MTLLKRFLKTLTTSPRRRPRQAHLRRRPLLESLETRNLLSAVPFESPTIEPLESGGESVELAVISSTPSQTATQDSPQPVLMVISNQDFWYQDYADTRAALERAGLEVVIAAGTMDPARPHDHSGQGSTSGTVDPDLQLADVNAEDYSAVVFVGGWGMSQYQYAFEGTYHNDAYQGDLQTKQVVNELVNDFVAQDKYVTAVCYGVSVLAYARVDGESPLAGRDVTGWNGAAPGAEDDCLSARQQIESSGATMLASASIGDPRTSSDDVVVDGKIITAENYDSAAYFGEVVAAHVIADHEAHQQTAHEAPLPVLMVIANQDFYHREYFETRASLEAAGLEVIVAAATTETAVPHAISVVEGREALVRPDLALADVSADDYSSIVFVGGWGAASYQYAFEGTYDNASYRGEADIKQVVNDLIGDFVAQDKYVAAICNGVSVLAWARVDGVSPLAGHTVSAWADTLPSANGGEVQVTREHVEANGATQVASGSVGDPTTVADDVIVDGKIITAENYDSAYWFGEVIAEQLMQSLIPAAR